MAELWITLTPILLVDMISPVLFASLVYAAGTDRSVVNSSALLVGHTVAYLAAGIVLFLGLEEILSWLYDLQPIDFAVEFVVGAILLWFAFKPNRGKVNEDPVEQAPTVTPASAFRFGATINLMVMPYAVMYLAALSQILKADLTLADSLFIVLLYNVFYALPFAIVPVLAGISGERSRPLLQRISRTLDRISVVLIPILLAVAGFALLADSIHYFWAGKPLF